MQRHRRETLRQIWLPFGAGLLVIAAAAAATVWGQVGTARLWADIALVWVVSLVLVAGTLVLAAVVGAVAASEWLIRWIPPRAARLQDLAAQVPPRVERGADALVRPLVAIRSLAGVLGRLAGRRV